MHRRLTLLALSVWLSAATVAQVRPDRVSFAGQEAWLNGGNVAWVQFAQDVGPGETRLDLFEAMFRELHEAGGNSFRLWLHTNGQHTPAWAGQGGEAVVVGPGEGTLEDLRAILDLAHQHDIGLMLCLWSFDMLRIAFGPDVTDRNFALLTREDRLDAYITRSLVPMVEALRGHPAVLAWEIFNEPEGMSEEFGWAFNRHVPMANIQRFINRTAGAIKRADPEVLVTNGSWSFRAASDVTSGREALLPGKAAADLTPEERDAVHATFARLYGADALTPEQAAAAYDTLRAWAPNFNYYSDERLIAAGGDSLGTLDFYTVHYYDWALTLLSPFHHDASFWGLDKPLVVAEFYLNDTFGVPWDALYPALHQRGYAGAMGWQWFDHWANREGIAHNWPRTLDNVRTLYRTHPADVRLRLRPSDP